VEYRIKTRLALCGLIVGHWLFGLIFGALVFKLRQNVFPDSVLATFIGLEFAQSSLLGIWLGSGTNRLWFRISIVLLALAYLTPQFGLSIDELQWHIAYVVSLTTLPTAMLLFGCRHWGYAICQTEYNDASHAQLQFSIRQIMLLTLAVAVLLTVAKFISRDFLDGELLMMTIIALPLVVVGTSAVWVILRPRRPLLGAIALSIVAAGLGAIVGHFLIDEVVYWLYISISHVATLIVTLTILRLCGYRLIR